MSIVVASTIAAYKCDGYQEHYWLSNAEALRHYAGTDVQFFCAIEVDSRGLGPFAGLVADLQNAGGTYWTFSLDDRSTERTSGNRLVRICTGRNLAHEYAMRDGAVSHLLFLDTDIKVPNDAIPKLLEVNRPVVGGHVGIYALDGPKVDAGIEGADVREHWNTAGFLMLSREVFRQVAWNYDFDAGLSDDPAFQRATAEKFGPTWVRHDVLGEHCKIPMVPIEHRGHDRKVYR